MADVRRKVALAVYYGVAWRLPTQPVPGWRLGYWWRRRLLRNIVDRCGEGVIVKQSATWEMGQV